MVEGVLLLFATQMLCADLFGIGHMAPVWEHSRAMLISDEGRQSEQQGSGSEKAGHSRSQHANQCKASSMCIMAWGPQIPSCPEQSP